MASLERATASIDHLLNDNRDALNSGMQGLSNLGPAVRDMREALDALRTISNQLNDNPARYLLGRDKTKEFRP
jgi:phospholipid/cholesterol/gamma-HCH transport system substrate-binding protein